ncbi:L,D-transpeptidase [Hyunsoonleella rubra]|uniref:L,D-transpeptidase n=1 Tax=Hyunsoonleella rubra TaxID=1737062 RepID=A0ABW5T5U3_9FLAO
MAIGNMKSKVFPSIFLTIILLVAIDFCCPKDDDYLNTSLYTKAIPSTQNQQNIIIKTPITIENYFQFIDSIVKKHDTLVPYKLSEHLLVRANSWIIDTLKNTDYYLMMQRDSFVYNQKEMIVLPTGAQLILPDSILAQKLLQSFQKTHIDINIPEFKLRIYEDTLKLHEFPIRVGRNERKYLKMADGVVDLKTRTGTGHIVKHVRNPDYYNPVNGHKYFLTKRDDGKVTKLPQIPFIETEINGVRNGQLIHPTTNPITLNKAYSNGCIGTKESDVWVIYYYAPIGTKIKVRYDLTVVDSLHQKLILEDIYN